MAKKAKPKWLVCPECKGTGRYRLRDHWLMCHRCDGNRGWHEKAKK